MATAWRLAEEREGIGSASWGPTCQENGDLNAPAHGRKDGDKDGHAADGRAIDMECDHVGGTKRGAAEDVRKDFKKARSEGGSRDDDGSGGPAGSGSGFAGAGKEGK